VGRARACGMCVRLHACRCACASLSLLLPPPSLSFMVLHGLVAADVLPSGHSQCSAIIEMGVVNAPTPRTISPHFGSILPGGETFRFGSAGFGCKCTVKMARTD